MQKNLLLATVMITLLAIGGCDRAPRNSGPQYGDPTSSAVVPSYRLAVHPLHNPAKLLQSYQPLVCYLNQRIEGARLTIEASKDYADFERKYRMRGPAFLLPNPWQTLQAMELGYRVIAMAGDPDDFRGVFIIRKDSSISHPADLKGQSVSYPSPTALAACIMPQYYLYNHGIDVNKDIENLYVRSQESAILNAFLGKTAIAATWPPPWRAFQKDFPEKAAELKIIWQTEPLLNNSFMVRDDVPADIREQVRKELTALHQTDEGQKILSGMETTSFTSATNGDYDRVRTFVGRFEQNVRKVDQQ